MKYSQYIIYNLICFFLSAFLLFFANTFVNQMLLPESLKWKIDGSLRRDLTGLAIGQTILLIIEGILLTVVLYLITKALMNAGRDRDAAKVIAKQIAQINLIATLCFIAILIWGSFRG